MNLEENGESFVTSNQKSILQQDDLGTFQFESDEVEANSSGISIREIFKICQINFLWLPDLLIFA